MSEELDRAMAFSTKERLRRCFNISEITEKALLVMHDEIERLRERIACCEEARRSDIEYFNDRIVKAESLLRAAAGDSQVCSELGRRWVLAAREAIGDMP